jgi:hypothetical protein
VYREEAKLRESRRGKSKLEKLLAQADIFECLRKINMGIVKSYDELDSSTHQTGNIRQSSTSRRVLG